MKQPRMTIRWGGAAAVPVERREREGDQPGVPTVWFRFYRGGCIKQLE